jgi:hypothetical protein
LKTGPYFSDHTDQASIGFSAARAGRRGIVEAVTEAGETHLPTEEERHTALTEEIAVAWGMLIKEHPFLAGVERLLERP